MAEPSAAPCDRLPPTDLRRICTSGKLVVARYEGERPPFFFRSKTGEWAGFDVDTNRVTILAPGRDPEQLALMPKDQVAEEILDRVGQRLGSEP